MSASDDFLRDLGRLLTPVEHKQEIGYDASGGDTTIEIDLDFATKKTIAIDVYFTDMDQADGEIKLQQKAGDGDRWNDISGSAQTLSTSSDDVNTYNIASFGGKFLRLVFTANSVTAGTIERLLVMAKPA